MWRQLIEISRKTDLLKTPAQNDSGGFALNRINGFRGSEVISGRIKTEFAMQAYRPKVSRSVSCELVLPSHQSVTL